MASRKLSTLMYTSFAHFTNDGNFLLFPLLINYYKTLDANFFVLAAGAIIYDLISGLLSPVIGRLADRTNAYGFLIFTGLAAQGASMAVFGAGFLLRAHVNYIIVAGTIILGFGQAFYHPLGGTVLSKQFRGVNYGRALGINGSVGSVGRAVVQLSVGVIIPFAGFTDSFFFVAVYEIIAAFIILNGLKWIPRNGKDKTAERKTSKVNAETFRKYRGIIYTLAAVVFVRSIYSSGIVTFLPYYISTIFRLPPSSPLPSEILFLAFLSPIFGQPLFGVLTAKLGGKATITLTSILAVVFSMIFMLTDSVYVVTAGLAGFAFAVFSGFPVLIGYVSELVPKDILTASSGLVWGMGSTVGGALGIGIFYIIHGMLKFSVAYSMWALIVMGVVSVLMIPLLPKRRIMDESTAG